jgi:hypothetical protein
MSPSPRKLGRQSYGVACLLMCVSGWVTKTFLPEGVGTRNILQTKAENRSIVHKREGFIVTLSEESRTNHTERVGTRFHKNEVSKLYFRSDQVSITVFRKLKFKYINIVTILFSKCENYFSNHEPLSWCPSSNPSR